MIYIKFNNAIPLQLYLLLYYFIYREGCTYTPDFLNRLKEACPDARVTTEIGEGGKNIETNSYFITTFLLYTFGCIVLLNVKVCYIIPYE